MRTLRRGVATRLSVALLSVVGWSATAEPRWTELTNPPPNFLDTCNLLTDGTALCHRPNTNRWLRLTPDIYGSYANGTWSSVRRMPDGVDPSFGCMPCLYGPLYFASAVLPDGRLIVIGGEYNSLAPVWTNIGFIFDPVANTWSTQLNEAFGGGRIGDASGIVLADGTFVLSDIASGNIEALDLTTLTFTPLDPPGKDDINNEENWNILPDGTLLTVDARIPSSFEIYDPVRNEWLPRGATPVNLADCCGEDDGVGFSLEVGPGVLRPDGTLVYFSGNSLGQNAVYDTSTGSWSHTAAMDFPVVPGETYHFSVADGPASLLPDGHVLVQASPVINGSPFNTPSHFYEFDGASLTQVPDSPNAASFRSYQGRMLLLPTGEVLLTAYDQLFTQDVLLYSNGGLPSEEWRPVITAAPDQVEPGSSHAVAGTLFNGLSEGASYGDDAQSSTNYPLVRITNNATGHVFYARTHDHSRMGVQAVGDSEIVTTQFDVPLHLEPGPSSLEVVVNGVASRPVTVNRAATTLSYSGDLVIATGTTAALSGVLSDDGSGPIAGETVRFTLGAGVSEQSCDAVTNASGFAACSISPVEQPLGPGVVASSFAGTSDYSPSSTSADITIFAFLGSGSFAVGDLSASLGASVTFWGSRWDKANALSGGSAPSAFKGFVDAPSTQLPSCGSAWTSSAGGSSKPPASVPAFMGVVVPTAVARANEAISGNVGSIVIVQTNPGYASDPSFAGTGTIVAQYCHP